MPIPLVVGPNMNIHEDQHRWSLLLLVSYSAVCKRIITYVDVFDVTITKRGILEIFYRVFYGLV